jgi:hypothetical protein
MYFTVTVGVWAIISVHPTITTITIKVDNLVKDVDHQHCQLDEVTHSLDRGVRID